MNKGKKMTYTAEGMSRDLEDQVLYLSEALRNAKSERKNQVIYI